MRRTLEHLKQLRRENNLSQKEMAEVIGVSLSMYEKVERGNIKASRNFMEALKNTYPHIDIDFIFFN